MPTKSVYPDIDIPNVDLWGLMFERKREEDFPLDQVLYRDAVTNRFYTYSTIKETAQRFGEGLRSQWNWQKGDVLTLFGPNSIDMPAVIYGTLFAGGIVSPANPAYSVEELTFQVKNNGCKAVATVRSLLPVATAAAQKAGVPLDRVFLIDDARDPENRFKHFDELVKAAPNKIHRQVKLDPDVDLAFLVYSSGTTGLPKGVMLSHRNMVSVILMVSSCVGKSYAWQSDKLLGVLPFYHIYGLTCLIHQPLYRGIEMITMHRFNLELFLETVQRHGVTFTYVAPPVLLHLAQKPIVEKYNLRSLRMVTSGAAPLTQELVDAVHKRINIKVNQAYGLSETSPITHAQPWDEWYSSVGSIGKLMPNMTSKYLSEDGEEVPACQTGELCLKGPNVFKGYWRNDEATKNSFTPDGFFKTGDVGHVDEKHDFYITDRIKELIKYKGSQVPPSELEGLILSHPSVNDVAVIGVYLKAEHTEVPRAYIVLGSNIQRSEDTANSIIQWMNSKVAYHKKLRGGVRFVDEIPKNPSGKILRRVLRDQAKEEEKDRSSKL